MKKNKTTILWDFDGVIMNSNHIRDLGFERVLEEFPKKQVDELMNYHRKNGGLSRYNKFRYFFEKIRKEEVTEEIVYAYADKFSKIMLSLLIDESLLINETLEFIKKEYINYTMHIVSGSAQIELRHICNELNISKYFVSIHGSPTPKNDLVNQVLENYSYKPERCLLIGDSINDYIAAEINKIDFIGYGDDNHIINKSTISPLF